MAEAWKVGKSEKLTYPGEVDWWCTHVEMPDGLYIDVMQYTRKESRALAARMARLPVYEAMLSKAAAMIRENGVYNGMSIMMSGLRADCLQLLDPSKPIPDYIESVPLALGEPAKEGQ